MNTKNYNLNPEITLPMLPDRIPSLPEPSLTKLEVPHTLPGSIWPRIRNLRCGCYLINYKPKGSSLLNYEGTLRVECHNNGRTASGDLYQSKVLCIPIFPPIPKLGIPKEPIPKKPRIKCFLLPGPNPGDGIPIFARGHYRYYLSVTQIPEWLTKGNSFTLGFEMWRFDSNTKKWTNEGTYTAQMSWTAAPAGYPSSGDYLEGDVKNSAGAVVGRLTMGWVSKYLRKATVEIDRVTASETPLNNGAGVDWRSIFDQIGWDVKVYESNTNMPEPSGESWSDAECHDSMLKWRDSANLDAEWRYHLLCVRRLDSTSRGIMYDAYGGDSNKIPREGAAMSSHWQFTNDPMHPENYPWGKCAKKRYGQCTAAYFRTAVHEIGHAMMEYHPSSTTGNHIMQVTPRIAVNCPSNQFPDCIEWAFSPDDQYRLRHLPDVVVRPGSVLGFGEDVGAPISPQDVKSEIEGLRVQVSPLLETVPMGAPVRVNFRLVNNGSLPVPVPGRLNMKAGHITGKVIDSSGTVRIFSTIVRDLDEYDLQMLEPEQDLADSLTLLRGPDGALFQTPGIHQVIVTITWDVDGNLVQLSGDTSVMVTPPVDEDHAKTTYKVLTTPDTLVTLVVGGDHLTDGIKAIQVAIKNPVLRPHFAYIEGKRLAQRFGKRKADLKAAAVLITDETVMSPAEIKKSVKLVKAEGADSAPGKSIAKILKNKAKELDVGDEIKSMVDSL